eukprot:gene12683-13985_t
MPHRGRKYLARKCDKCSLRFYSHFCLLLHLKNHAKAYSGWFKCFHCEKKFEKLLDAVKHRERHRSIKGKCLQRSNKRMKIIKQDEVGNQDVTPDKHGQVETDQKQVANEGQEETKSKGTLALTFLEQLRAVLCLEKEVQPVDMNLKEKILQMSAGINDFMKEESLESSKCSMEEDLSTEETKLTKVVPVDGISDHFSNSEMNNDKESKDTKEIRNGDCLLKSFSCSCAACLSQLQECNRTVDDQVLTVTPDFQMVHVEKEQLDKGKLLSSPQEENLEAKEQNNNYPQDKTMCRSNVVVNDTDAVESDTTIQTLEPLELCQDVNSSQRQEYTTTCEVCASDLHCDKTKTIHMLDKHGLEVTFQEESFVFVTDQSTKPSRKQVEKDQVKSAKTIVINDEAICTICFMKFARWYNMKRHMMKQHNVFAKKSGRSSLLTASRKEEHRNDLQKYESRGGVKRGNCNTKASPEKTLGEGGACGKHVGVETATTFSALDKNRQNVAWMTNFSKKSFACISCDFSFSGFFILRSHLKVKHGILLDLNGHEIGKRSNDSGIKIAGGSGANKEKQKQKANSGVVPAEKRKDELSVESEHVVKQKQSDRSISEQRKEQENSKPNLSLLPFAKNRNGLYKCLHCTLEFKTLLDRYIHVKDNHGNGNVFAKPRKENDQRMGKSGEQNLVSPSFHKVSSAACQSREHSGDTQGDATKMETLQLDSFAETRSEEGASKIAKQNKPDNAILCCRVCTREFSTLKNKYQHMKAVHGIAHPNNTARKSIVMLKNKVTGDKGNNGSDVSPSVTAKHKASELTVFSEEKAAEDQPPLKKFKSGLVGEESLGVRCDLCMKYFARKRNRNRHLKRKHHVTWTSLNASKDAKDQRIPPSDHQSSSINIGKTPKANKESEDSPTGNRKCDSSNNNNNNNSPNQPSSIQNVEVVTSQVETNSCHACNKVFNSHKHLLHHKVQCRCKLSCPILGCRMTFETVWSYDFHVKNTCTLCHARLGSGRNLKRHYRNVHKIKCLLSCDLCDEKFAEPVGLATHNKEKHLKS